MPAHQERIRRIYILLMLGLFPLCGGAYRNITYGKTLSFLLLSGGLLLALLLDRLLCRSKEQRSLLPPLLTRPCCFGMKSFLSSDKSRALRFVRLFWLLLAASALLSALCSPYLAQTWLGAGRSGGLLMLWLYLLLAGYFSRREELRPLYIYVLAVSALLLNLLALLQLAGYNPLGLYPAGLTYYDAGSLYPEAFLGTIGNLNQLGAFYCLAVPLLLGQAWLEKASWRRWPLLAVALLCCGIALVARMEACCLGLACGLALSLPGLSSRPWLRRYGYACLIFLGLAFLAYALFFPGPVGSSWWQLHRLLRGMGADHFGSMRLGIWRVAWEALSQRPLLGWGADVFRLVYEDLFPPGAVLDAVHNEYLAYWCDAGLLGFCAYLGGLLVSLVCWLRRSLVDRRCLLPFAMGCCYGVQALFTFSTPLVSPLWWLLWGLGLGLLREEPDATPDAPEPAKTAEAAKAVENGSLDQRHPAEHKQGSGSC